MGLDALALSWVVTIYLLATVVLLVPFGRLGDLLGRARIFVAGLLVTAVASALLALTQTGPALLALRAVQGLGAAMGMSTGMAIVTAAFPASARGRVLGINVAAVYLGLSAGPFLGGLLTEHLGWRSIFAVSAALGLLAAALAWAALPRERPESAGESFDLLGALLLGTALVALIDGLSLLPSRGGALAVASGLAGLLIFVAWEARVAHPVLDVRLFSGNPAFAMSNLAALINYAATAAVAFLLSLYLQVVRGLGPREAGLVLVAMPIVMMLLSPAAGRLSDRIAPRLVASAGMGLTALGLGLLALLARDSSLAYVVGVLLLLGLGFALFSSPNTNAVMSAVARRHYGVASATVATMRLTGQALSMGIAMLVLALVLGPAALGPAVAGELLAAVRLSAALFAGLCLLGVAASLARGRTPPAPAVEASPSRPAAQSTPHR